LSRFSFRCAPSHPPFPVVRSGLFFKPIVAVVFFFFLFSPHGKFRHFSFPVLVLHVRGPILRVFWMYLLRTPSCLLGRPCRPLIFSSQCHLRHSVLCDESSFFFLSLFFRLSRTPCSSRRCATISGSASFSPPFTPCYRREDGFFLLSLCGLFSFSLPSWSVRPTESPPQFC